MPRAGTDRLRVVFLTHNYPRHPGDVAGGFLHPFALALVERGVDLRVVAPSDAGQGGDDLVDGIAVTRVRYAAPARERYAYTGNMTSAVRSPAGMLALLHLHTALRDGARAAAMGADRVVVHAHWWMPAALAAPPELPMVVTCHGTDVRLLESSGIARWLARPPLRRARLVTTVSSALARTIEARAGVRVPPDAIQPMPVPALARPRSVGGGGIVVLGRLTAQKRIGIAIEAWAHARSAGLPWALTIVGDGPMRSALEAQARAVAPDGGITFRGAVAPSAVPAELAHADLMVMPAEREGLGLAAAEALMQGVPVVACSDGGGVLDVVQHGAGGRVVAPEARALAAAMLGSHADSAARDAAWDAGQQWRARLAPGFVADRAMTWYERALHG
jgi:glycosyltransferase involved in cell wall biosynthesis